MPFTCLHLSLSSFPPSAYFCVEVPTRTNSPYMCLKITFAATGPSLAKDDSKITMEILCLGKGKMKRDTVAYRRKGAMVRGHRVSAVKRGNSPKRRSEREIWARGQPNQGCARLWTCDLTRFNFSWSNPFVIEKKKCMTLVHACRIWPLSHPSRFLSTTCSGI